MLRNWKTIALVLALLLIGEGVARAGALQRLFDPVDGSVQAARWRYIYAPATPDVLIMGDSRAVMDLSPGILQEDMREKANVEITALNVAAHGSSMEQSYLMLSEVILGQKRPGLVVLNISEVALSDAAWTDNPPLYLRGLARPLGAETWRQAPGRAAVLESLSALLRLQHRLRLTVEERWPNQLRGRETYDWGGSLWHGKMSPATLDEQFKTSHDKFLAGFAPDGEQGQFLPKLLQRAHEADLHMVLIITPVTDRYLSALPHPEDVDRFRELVCDAAAEYGVPIFDYYRTAELGEEHYFDLHHTNAEGTAIFSRMVARDIVVPALADWDRFVAEQQLEHSSCAKAGAP